MGLKLGTLTVDINANTKGLKKAEKEVSRSNKAMTKGFNKLGAAIAVAISLESARRIVLIADNMTLLKSRVDNLSTSQSESNNLFKEMVKISNTVGTSIDGTVKAFQRFALAKDTIGASNEELLTFTETIQKLGIVSGATSQEVLSTSIQIGQALTNNFESAAQEINSINEQMPAVARAVEKSLGLAAGSFKREFSEGGRTSKEFFDAIIDAAEEADKKFDGLAVTVSRSFTKLTNNLAVAISDLDKMSGLTAGISKMLDTWADKVKEFSDELQNSAFSNQAQISIKINALLTEQNENVKRIAGSQKVLNSIFASPNTKRVQTERIEALKKQNIEIQKQIDLLSQETKKNRDEKLKADKPDEPAVSGETTEQMKKRLKKEIAILELHGLQRKDTLEAADLEIEAELLKFQLSMLANFEAGSGEMLEVEKLMNQMRVDEWEKSSQDIIDIEKDRQKELKALRQAQKIAQLTSASDIFGSMAQIAGDAEGEQSTQFKRLIQLQRSFAIASAALALGVNVAAASKEGFPQNLAFIAGAFAQGAQISSIINSAKMGGGRQMGGNTSSILAHPINEGDTPEILTQAGKQFLIPNGKTGNVTPLKGGGANSNITVSIISNGEPQVITGKQVSQNQVAIMIDNAVQQHDQAINTSLASGRGNTFKALSQGARIERNIRGAS